MARKFRIVVRQTDGGPDGGKVINRFDMSTSTGPAACTAMVRMAREYAAAFGGHVVYHADERPTAAEFRAEGPDPKLGYMVWDTAKVEPRYPNKTTTIFEMVELY